jgi:hypothetical protein
VPTCTPASGTVFPKGSTTVTCNVSDASGNAATPCSFTVTVNDTQPPTITCPANISTTTAVGGNRAAFKRRQQNSINYDSPNFGGFQVMAAFTSSQPSTGTLNNATNNKARVLSLGAQYSAGPLYVSAGYEQHRDFAGAGGPDGSHDNGWHIGAAYTWGPVRFGGQYTEQRFDVPAGVAGGDVKARAWHAGRYLQGHGLDSSRAHDRGLVLAHRESRLDDARPLPRRRRARHSAGQVGTRWRRRDVRRDGCH